LKSFFVCWNDALMRTACEKAELLRYEAIVLENIEKTGPLDAILIAGKSIRIRQITFH